VLEVQGAHSYLSSLSPVACTLSYELSADARLLVTEWDSHDEDAQLLNATWVEVPESGVGPVDIALPTPARELVRTEFTLELPSTGAVVGADMALPVAPSAQRLEGTTSLMVGRATLEPGADEDHYAWIIDALTGEMAPTESQVGLESEPVDGSSRSMLVTVNLPPEEVVTVPPAALLETSGDTLDDLSVAWSAPEYTHAGASIEAWQGPGSWYTYTFAGSESAPRPWPRLPEAVTREDVGLGSDEFKVHVFAVTQEGVPWDWYAHRNRRAVVVSTRAPPPEPPLEGEVPTKTGPLYLYDGIYRMNDITLNWSSCAEEGPPSDDDSLPPYFVVVGLGDRRDLAIGGCNDPADDCRVLANTFWTEGSSWGTQWRLQSSFPASGKAHEWYTRSGSSTDELCVNGRLHAVTTTATIGESIRFTVERIDVPSHPPDDAGECTSEVARAAAKGLPCSSLVVYSGNFFETLY
jgi:hypothetical protein